MTPTSYDEWIGRTAVDNTGDKVGEIKDIFYDDVTGRPEWLEIKTGLLGGRSYVPINGATIREHTDPDTDADLQLAYAKDQIKAAPDADVDDEHMDVEDEKELYAHYGFDYSATSGVTTYGNEWGKLRPDIDYPITRAERHGSAVRLRRYTRSI